MARFNLERHRDQALFHLMGKMNLEDTARLRKEIWTCLNERGLARLVIDLSRMPVLDAALISLLVASKSLAERAKVRLTLLGLSPEQYQLFLENHLHVYFDLEDEGAAAPDREPAG